MMDLVALYSATQARVIELVSPLSPTLLETLVPATPRWTINQVIMHVTGVCADLGAGIVEQASSEAWTDRQVTSRRLVNDDSDWVCGLGDAEVTGTATTMEWFRALFGRRSRTQVLTYEWRGDPQPYFDLLNLFGPLPAVDVAEAGAPVPAAHR
jgi:hypothetical protein